MSVVAGGEVPVGCGREKIGEDLRERRRGWERDVQQSRGALERRGVMCVTPQEPTPPDSHRGGNFLPIANSPPPDSYRGTAKIPRELLAIGGKLLGGAVSGPPIAIGGRGNPPVANGGFLLVR
eukprot:scaffold108574_cov30-Tisochrysis_lutea.AAC.1